MKFIQPFLLLSFLFTLSLWSATPVPYSGKIDIRGVNYFGDAQFAFSLHDGNGTTHWRNGNQPKETIKVTIRNGRYNVLLGGQGMNSLPPELFLNHDKLYLKVEVDMGDEEGLRHLAPDLLITATPRALVADLAKVSEVAKVAEKVGNGAITRDMLSSEVLAQLDANVTASPSTPVTITRDMLPQDVRDDLNKTVTITRSMLPADVLSDLNRTITKSMLGSDVLADLNKSSTTASPITLSMLAPEVTAKLDQNATIGASSITKSMLAQEVLIDLNGSTTVINPPVVGSTLAVPHGQNAPAGYSLYHQVGQPKELVWEEKAPVSVARNAFDGVEVLGNKIYFIGGWSGNREKLLERYDPLNDSWETLTPMNQAREAMTASLNGKIYAIGGRGYSGNPLSSVEIYDPVTNSWSNGVSLPSAVEFGVAIAMSQKIFLIGGKNASGQNLNQVLCYDPSSNQWIAKANMPTARCDHKLVWFENRIWAIGGLTSTILNKVESYDPLTDSWQTEASLTTARQRPVAWVANGRIYVGGGYMGSPISSIEVYDHISNLWTNAGNFPENKSNAGSVVLNEKVYVIGGSTASGVYSNKVFAADLNASAEGIYDLYRKDGNASAGTPIVQAEVADGSIGPSKLSSEVSNALKPVLVGQPRSVVEVGGNPAYLAVDASGSDNSYQWKKDGVDITGATGSILSIADLNASQHEGNYTVVVSNAFGSATSSVAQIDVNGSLTEGLVGWWKFDETDGNVASDSSGNGNDGNLTNGPTWTEGKIGGALSFDGVDDFVELGNVLPASYTKVVWVKNLTTGVGNFLSFYPVHALFVENSYLKVLHNANGANVVVNSFKTIELNKWFHILVTYNHVGENIKMFLDGEFVFEAENFPSVGSNQGLLVGRFGSVTANSYGGLLDDIRIYDRALSAFEVKALYELGEQPVQESGSGTTTVVNGTVADGSITASKIASKTIGKDQISDSILKYLKPEITIQPQGKIVYADSNVSFSVIAKENIFLTNGKKMAVT